MMKRISLILAALITVMMIAVPANAQKKRTTTSKARTTATTKKTTTTTQKTTPAPTKPQAVDMGLSVKWCNMDFGGNGSMQSISSNLEGTLGEGWRLPSYKEFKELIDNSKCEIIVNGGIPKGIKLTSKKNGASITLTIPSSVWTIINGKASKNPFDGGYMAAYIASDNVVLLPTAKMDSWSQSSIKQTLKDLGVKTMNPTQWPDEIYKKVYSLGFRGFATDKSFSWFTKLEMRALSLMRASRQ